MLTNVVINHRLLAEAQRFMEALQSYIRIRKQKKILKLFGKINFDGTYDYKKQRGRR